MFCRRQMSHFRSNNCLMFYTTLQTFRKTIKSVADTRYNSGIMHLYFSRCFKHQLHLGINVMPLSGVDFSNLLESENISHPSPLSVGILINKYGTLRITIINADNYTEPVKTLRHKYGVWHCRKSFEFSLSKYKLLNKYLQGG